MYLSHLWVSIDNLGVGGCFRVKVKGASLDFVHTGFFTVETFQPPYQQIRKTSHYQYVCLLNVRRCIDLLTRLDCNYTRCF